MAHFKCAVYEFLCVCLSMHSWIYMCRGPKDNLGHHFLGMPLTLFWGRVSHCLGLYSWDYSGCFVSPRDPPVSVSSASMRRPPRLAFSCKGESDSSFGSSEQALYPQSDLPDPLTIVTSLVTLCAHSTEVTFVYVHNNFPAKHGVIEGLPALGKFSLFHSALLYRVGK